MTRAMRAPFHLAAMSLLLALGGCGGSEGAGNGNTSAAVAETALPATVDLRMATKDGRRHRFEPEVALGPQAQQQGLQGRASLSEDGGMLFPFDRPNMASFWMKDTLIPLDLLFIRADGTIVTILEGEPGSLRPLAANEPVIAVLELAGGRAAALGIAAGDRVEWGDCRASPASEVSPTPRFCPSAAP